MDIYPGSAPEFRILEKQDGTRIFQVRYVNITVGYKSMWYDVPIVKDY